MNLNKKISVECLSCHKKNSYSLKRIIKLKKSVACSSCKEDLLPFWTKKFSSIKDIHFVHPFDKDTLLTLKKIPKIESILGELIKHSFEQSMRLYHQSAFIKVYENQGKDLHELLIKACDILDIEKLPELYVFQDSKINAYTFGTVNYGIAISSAAINFLTEQELLCVIAHELGHIKANHVLFKTASRLLANASLYISQRTLGLSSVLLFPIQAALSKWDRMSELSADRASLLVVKSPKIVVETLMKLAGGDLRKNFFEPNFESFLDQVQSFEDTQKEGLFGSYFNLLDNVFNSHPMPIWRAKNILTWVGSGDYFDLLQGKYKNAADKVLNVCKVCKKVLSGKNCKNCQKNKTQKISDSVYSAVKNVQRWYDEKFEI